MYIPPRLSLNECERLRHRCRQSRFSKLISFVIRATHMMCTLLFGCPHCISDYVYQPVYGANDVSSGEPTTMLPRPVTRVSSCSKGGRGRLTTHPIIPELGNKVEERGHSAAALMPHCLISVVRASSDKDARYAQHGTSSARGGAIFTGSLF